MRTAGTVTAAPADPCVLAWAIDAPADGEPALTARAGSLAAAAAAAAQSAPRPRPVALEYSDGYGEGLVVDLDGVFRSDQQPREWAAAAVTL
jgi:hypothetical protein